MSTDLLGIMNCHSSTQALLHDPDLTGEVLLLAVCMRSVLFDKAPRGEKWLTALRRGWGDGRSEDELWGTWRRVLRQDAPRYEPVGDPRGGCTERAGDGVCGKRAYTRFVDRCPTTGDGVHVAYCTGHWSHERDMYRQRRHRAWVENGAPEPLPNVGGVLSRHFRGSWASWYADAAGHEVVVEERVRPEHRLALVPAAVGEES